MPPEKKSKAILLVTAFEPFDGAKTNSSQILLEKLQEMDWGGRVAFLGPVPVSFRDAWPIIEEEIRRHPDIQGVIAMGQAEGRSRISLERVAVNWIDAGIPDNYGVKPRKCPVIRNAPEVLWATFPWNEIEDSPCWQKSYSAGTYLCNTVMYHLLDWGREEGKTAGFVHIPLLKSQDPDPALGKGAPRMDDAAALKGLRRIIGFALEKLEEKPDMTPSMKPAPFHRPPPSL